MYNKYLALILLIVYGCGGSGNKPPKPPDPSLECDAIVNWIIPTERTDGSELLPTDIDKFTIFINAEPGVNESTLERVVDIIDNSLTQWTVPELSEGEHWFYMTVTDIENRESTFSNELTKICER